jgi:hypothetical protein
MTKRTLLRSAVVAAGFAAVLIADSAATASGQPHTSSEALSHLRSGYADPDPDFSQANWGTDDAEDNTVPPVLGPQHALDPSHRRRG